jgi:hypothetical protein
LRLDLGAASAEPVHLAIYHIQKIADIYKGLQDIIPKLSGSNAQIAKELANGIQDALSSPDKHGLIAQLDPTGSKQLQAKVDNAKNGTRYYVAAEPLGGVLGNPSYDPLPGYVTNPPPPQVTTIPENCVQEASYVQGGLAGCAGLFLPHPDPVLPSLLGGTIYPLPALPPLTIPPFPGVIVPAPDFAI